VDTESYGNFTVKGPYAFQRGRLSAVRGKDWLKTGFLGDEISPP
jgi:hypothetical protein